jgi:hypothetical protein
VQALLRQWLPHCNGLSSQPKGQCFPPHTLESLGRHYLDKGSNVLVWATLVTWKQKPCTSHGDWGSWPQCLGGSWPLPEAIRDERETVCLGKLSISSIQDTEKWKLSGQQVCFTWRDQVPMPEDHFRDTALSPELAECPSLKHASWLSCLMTRRVTLRTLSYTENVKTVQLQLRESWDSWLLWHRGKQLERWFWRRRVSDMDPWSSSCNQ